MDYKSFSAEQTVFTHKVKRLMEYQKDAYKPMTTTMKPMYKKLKEVRRLAVYDEHARRFLSNDITEYYKKNISSKFNAIWKYEHELQGKEFRPSGAFETWTFGEIINFHEGRIRIDLPNFSQVKTSDYKIETIMWKLKNKEWILS